VCSSYNNKQQKGAVQDSSDDEDPQNTHYSKMKKKVKLFSSVRPPQQESGSPTERDTHTIVLKNLLGLLGFVLKE